MYSPGSGLKAAVAVLALGLAGVTGHAAGPVGQHRHRPAGRPLCSDKPPGFVLLASDLGHVLCMPVDKPWVTQALTTAKPATRPTTMPADLLTKLDSTRPILLRKFAADFAIADTSAMSSFLDEHLLPDLHLLDQFVAPVYFLVCSESDLKDLCKAAAGPTRLLLQPPVR